MERQWIYDGQLRPVAEMDGSGALVSQFVYATHINVPDYIVVGGVTYRVITDHLGSLRFVIDTATGTIAQRMDYDDWGNVLVNTAPDFTPFGFAGGMYDSQTKLVRFGARDYDPECGRWTCKDPIGFGGYDPNLYAYCINDPLNHVDVKGTKCFKDFWKEVAKNFKITNDAILGLMAPPFAASVSGVSGALASALETTTFGSWAAGGFGGMTLGGASFSAVETGILATATSALGWASTGLSFEAGIGIGSIINVIAFVPCDCP